MYNLIDANGKIYVDIIEYLTSINKKDLLELKNYLKKCIEVLTDANLNHLIQLATNEQYVDRLCININGKVKLYKTNS